MTEEEIKKLQTENETLKETNRKLTEENASLKSKNEEQSDSIKGIKDDIEKLKTEMRDGFAKTQEKIPTHDNKPKTLLEEIINAKRE